MNMEWEEIVHKMVLWKYINALELHVHVYIIQAKKDSFIMDEYSSTNLIKTWEHVMLFIEKLCMLGIFNHS